ncbi:MAG: L-lactate permease [Candidatus Woesearchaeota archaeon]
MNFGMLFFLAISPLVLILILLLVFHVKLLYSSILTLLYTIGISVYIWQIETLTLGAAIYKGIFVGIDIALIVGGALLYVYFYKNSGRMKKLQRLLTLLSDDKRVQILLLGFFFVGFLEGTAGFGVPAAVVAPLLVALSITPVAAVAIALIGDSTAVAFGAVGTPLRVGFETVDITGVTFTTAILNSIVLAVIPLSILAVYEFQKKDRSLQSFYAAIPLGLLATISFAIPFIVISYVGYDFPTLLGSIIGAGIFIVFQRYFTERKSLHKGDILFSDLHFVFMPYILFISLFVIIRYISQTFDFVWFISLSDTISHTFNPFNPGIIFLLVVLFYSFYGTYTWSLSQGSVDVSKKLYYPFIVILAITSFVQIMVHSHTNASNLDGMIQVAASILRTDYLLFVSGFVGVLGTFVAGSATVSNLLFGELQEAAAVMAGLPVFLILALQLTGAAVGNMISLTNIVAAQSTVKLQNKEKDILKLTLIPCLVYITLAGVVAYFGFLLFF